MLKQLCYIQAPSGNEEPMKEFILDYVEQHKHEWKVQPQIVYGEEFQDTLMLVFGEPRTAMFAHMDNIGFMTKYGTELVKVGGPVAKHNYVLVGEDEKGKFEYVIKLIQELHKSGRPILVGTVSVDKSEYLSKKLGEAGVKHNVLNAKQHEKEAEVVGAAGQK